MATSGTYSFTMTRDQICEAALRLTGSFDAADTIPPEDLQNVAQALNILAKELATEGLPLWCVQDIPFAANLSANGTYNLSTITGQTLPLRILDAYRVDSTGNRVTLTITSRYDWDTLGQPQASGIANQLWYDPQLSGGIVTLYNVPGLQSTDTIHVVIQRQVQDFNLGTDNPDFPQEAFRLLKWCLADEISLEYQATPDVRKDIAARAITLRKSFFAYDQEQASIFFTPSERGL